MAILHGSWVPQGYLFLWGETWRRVTPIALADAVAPTPLPLALAHSGLVEALQSFSQQGTLNWALPQGFSGQGETASSPLASGSPLEKVGHNAQISWGSQILAVPTLITETTATPHYSAGTALPEDSDGTLYLYPWQLEGLCLPPKAALEFLNGIPLGVNADSTVFSGELRFWSQVARWSLDLLARSKFLPRLEHTAQGDGLAYWQPLLDSSVDQVRLEHFIRHMPTACRLYQVGDTDTVLAVDLPPSGHALVFSALTVLINSQIQAIASRTTLDRGQLGRRESQVALESWLSALTSAKKELPKTSAIDRLATTLHTWVAPLEPHLVGQPLFRVALTLNPSVAGGDWQLMYSLQSVSDPTWHAPASVIWSHPVDHLTYRGRRIPHPQETLLAGLGLASRLYAPIEASLHTSKPEQCVLAPIQAYEFLKVAAWRLQDSGFGVVLPPGLASMDGLANRLGVRVSAEAIPKGQRIGLQSLLNVQLDLTIGNQTLSKADLDRLTSLGTPLVEINGEWVELRPHDVRSARSFFADEKEQTTLSLQDILRLSAGDTQVIERLPVVGFDAGPLQELITTLMGGNQTIEPAEAPSSFRGELRPYQARGVGWLAFLERWGLGACLADDMGLGKTIQAIAFLLTLKEAGTLEHPCLLVCPTSVLGNWEREVRKFAPTLTLLVHHDTKRPKGKAFTKAVQGKDLVITSYALVHRDAVELQGTPWQIVMLDEAQNIKNAESKQSQTARQLPAQFRVALTGTPVENRLAELWAILEFLNPGYLGSKPFFQRRFVIPIEKYGDTASLQTLRSLVQPFILRRLKTDKSIIQDLPEKQEMTVFCGLSAQQATLYQQLVQATMTEIESSDGIQRRGLILGLLVKLKQICNHPAHFLKEKTIVSAQTSGKLQRLDAMLEEVVAEGDRALIFTQFSEWGKLLQAHLTNTLNQEVLFLYGSTPRQKREEMVDRFQHDPQGPPILILSLKAGGTGLNLTRANHVFHFDRWWNPAVENQATDRAFRIGQTRNVQVHKFVCTGTLEERIHDLIESKKALAEQVVGAGENWLTDLDTNQLRDLLLLDRNAIIEDD